MLCRPLTPDCQPIIGATNCLGLFVNTGHSFNGWRQASLSAELLAKVVVAGSNSAMGEEAAALYKAFRGRLPGVEALLRGRGLAA